MERVDLNYVRLSHQGFRDSFISATGDVAFELGEPTSDYLAFFGFGSGRFQGPNPPAYLKTFINFDFPSVDDDDYDVFSLYRAFIKKLIDLKALGVYPDFQGIKEFIVEIFRLLDTTAPLSMESFFDIARAVYDSDLKAYDYNTQALVAFSVYEGKRHLSFGVNFVGSLTDHHKKDTWIEVPHGFNWNYYSQLGESQHAIWLLKAMLRHKFVSDWVPCEQALKKMIRALEIFFRG
jgi:hypothetical protein